MTNDEAIIKRYVKYLLHNVCNYDISCNIDLLYNDNYHSYEYIFRHRNKNIYELFNISFFVDIHNTKLISGITIDLYLFDNDNEKIYRINMPDLELSYCFNTIFHSHKANIKLIINLIKEIVL